MKILKLLVPALALLIGGALSVSKVMANESKGVDYAALGAKYEKLAVAQDAVISEHEAMKMKEEKKNPGKPGMSSIAKMNKHCNAIIKDAKKLKVDYESFAAWCKLMATEGVKK